MLYLAKNKPRGLKIVHFFVLYFNGQVGGARYF